MRVVYVYIRRIGNLRWSFLVGQLRNIADQFGKPGITGKRGQTNRRVKQQGYLRIVLPTRQMAIDFQDAVESFWGNRVETERYKLS
jgi:hypothetical protein